MALERGTVARLSLQRISRKINSLRNREYAKVEDAYDTRVPLHNEDAFQHGLKFKAKFIGSLEIARPTCKIDIITAMRRIRYEFKVKGIRKVRCLLDVSTQGVTISKRKRRRRRKHYSEEQLRVMQHPIYRIFYVSHDSQDLKIFSYITRESPDNTFRCNVFKAYKKSMALHIVRSLGQAFDVCHKANPRPQKSKAKAAKEKAGEEEEEGEGVNKDAGANLEGEMAKPHGAKASAEDDLKKDLFSLQFDPFVFPSSVPSEGSVPNGLLSEDGAGGAALVPPPPLTMHNTSDVLPDFPDGATELDIAQAVAIPPPHAHLAYAGRPRPRPSLTQQGQITENPFTERPTAGESPTPSIGEALGLDRRSPPHAGDDQQRQQLTAQLALMREQLKAETTARIESQARVEHLLMQNKELLSHLQKLMVQLQQLQSLHLSQTKPSETSAPPPETSAPPPETSSPPPESNATPSNPSPEQNPSNTVLPSISEQLTDEVTASTPPPAPSPPIFSPPTSSSPIFSPPASSPPAPSPPLATPSPPISPQPLLPSPEFSTPFDLDQLSSAAAAQTTPTDTDQAPPTDHTPLLQELPSAEQLLSSVEAVPFDPFEPFDFEPLPLTTPPAVPDSEATITSISSGGVTSEGAEQATSDSPTNQSETETAELLVTISTS